MVRKMGVKVTDAFIGLGTNLGNRAEQLRRAVAAMAALDGSDLVAVSHVYETPPVGPTEQASFYNAVVHLRTKVEPMPLLAQLRQIERSAGRPPIGQRTKWGPRELDLDILLYGDGVFEQADLCIPHPHMAERWFVLRPLADVAAERRHPVLGRQISELLTALEVGGDAAASGRGHKVDLVLATASNRPERR